MKGFKKCITVLLILVLVVAAVFAAGRYGWKLFGFSACGDAGIEFVEVGEDAVQIRGFYPGSFPAGFCGSYTREQDGTLYVGLRFSSVFGVFETGDFDVTIPVKGQISRVVLKTKTQERAIWTAQDNTAADMKDTEQGVYVKLECGDVRAVYLHGGSFTKVGENADGSAMKTGEWIFMGKDIAQLAQEENRAVLFTVGAQAADDTVLAEGSFLYDTAQGRLFVTIAEDGVTCSTANTPEAGENVPSVLTLPILEEIDRTVTLGTSGSSLLAVQAAAKLLDWGENTGLGADEISDAASTWLAAYGGSGPEDFLGKLEMVDDAYQKLLTDEARELLDSAGCADTQITWGHEPSQNVEAIMQAAGLR